MKKITAHVLIKNEENFIWFAIMSVIDYVDKILIFDTGSKDNTLEIIKTIESPKIVLEEKGSVDLNRYITLRQELVDKTDTDWFLQLDGDEVWPKDSIESLVKMIQEAQDNIVAIVNRTRNCVGDIYHYLPEGTGEYELLGRRGHLNIRALKKTTDLKVELAPPFNAYTETYINSEVPIPKQDSNLLFLDKYLWHLTHLKRSRFDDHGKRKWELGSAVAQDIKFPEVFSLKRPGIVSDPRIKMSNTDFFKSWVQTPLRRLKRRIT